MTSNLYLLPLLFQSHSSQCDSLDGKVIPSPMINILYLHEEITTTDSQMKILRKLQEILYSIIIVIVFANII